MKGNLRKLFEDQENSETQCLNTLLKVLVSIEYPKLLLFAAVNELNYEDLLKEINSSIIR